MLGMGFTHKNKNRARVATADEIKALRHAIDREDFDASPSMRLKTPLHPSGGPFGTGVDEPIP